MSQGQVLKTRVQRGVETLIRLAVAVAIGVTLAVLGLWDWAYLFLGLFILGEVSTVGMFVRRLVEERDYELRRSWGNQP